MSDFSEFLQDMAVRQMIAMAPDKGGMLRIDVYGKEGCGKCDAAKDKLKKMGLPFREHSLEYHINHHDGWKTDGSTDLRAWCDNENNTHYDMPVIGINGEFYFYAGAMKKLKEIKKGGGI